MAIVSNDFVLKSDALICLEGDGCNRAKETLRLFKKKLAKNIVISGGYNNPPFSIPAEKLVKFFLEKGVPSKSIILEEKSQNTLEQAKETMKIAKERKWKRIILVASHFHQLRAYLTFLKAMEDLKIKIEIFNAPPNNLSWFERTAAGFNRIKLLEKELKKIKEYQKKGHLVLFPKAIEYQKWKEKQN